MPLDSLGLLTLSATDQFPIPEELPDDFLPEQIIYREFDSTGRPVVHFYVDLDKPTPWEESTVIEGFVRDIALNGYVRNDPDLEEQKRLDIPVNKESYVVLQIHPANGYIFSPQNPAVTLKTMSPAPPNNLYGRLRYVDDDGNIFDHPIESCRLVYFAALHRPGTLGDPYLQGLNYNLETAGGVVTIIDPDIRHPGNGGED